MQMHALPQNSIKLGALPRSKAANLEHSKALDPNVLRFIPLLSMNSTYFNTFLLGRVRYSSPAFWNAYKDWRTLKERGKSEILQCLIFVFNSCDLFRLSGR
jgi:hypothetical protein